MSRIIYLKLSDYHQNLFKLVDTIQYEDNELYPEYEKFSHGLQELEGILEKVKAPYYKTFYDKIAFLFLAISTGHLFPNGNKRLAMVSFIFFIVRNYYTNRETSVEEALDFFIEYFPAYSLQVSVSGKKFNSIQGFVVYNFNKCINIKFLYEKKK